MTIVFCFILYVQFGDLEEWEVHFAKNFHMDKDTFEMLFSKVGPRLEPIRQTRPDGIGAKQRLAYTLELVICCYILVLYFMYFSLVLVTGILLAGHSSNGMPLMSIASAVLHPTRF